MNIDKFYMCHYSKLTERKKYIESHISKYNFDIEWILNFDKENINFDELEKHYPMINKLTPFGRKLSKPEISLCLKHIYVFHDVLLKGYENVIVFEDDIILCDDFDIKLKMYMNQLPHDFDVLWIGTCCDLHINNTKPNQYIYRSNSSRCTHAYLISKKGCQKMINDLSNLNHPIDWYFNYVIEKQKLENFWAEPDLVRQDLRFESGINSGKVE